jgi:hypothetical protein
LPISSSENELECLAIRKTAKTPRRPQHFVAGADGLAWDLHMVLQARPAFAGFLVLSLCACGGATEDSAELAPAAADTGPIIGGTADAPYPAVMFVGTSTRYCTGALIAPNLLISARHCFDQDDRASTGFERLSACGGGNDFTSDCTQTSFTIAKAADTAYYASPAAVRNGTSTPRYDVVEILRPPGIAFCDTDIALVIFDENVPGDIAHPVLPLLTPMTEHPPVATTFAQVGYGVTSIEQFCDGSGTPTRRVRANVPMLCIPGDAQIPCESIGPLFGIASMPDTSRVTANEWLAGEVICNGDSGGPAFDQGSLDAGNPTVVGLATRVGRDANQCTFSVFQRLDVHAEFVQAGAVAAAELGGYEVPLWARCHERLDGAECDDGDPCTGDDACSGGRCVPGAAIDCASPESEAGTDGGCAGVAGEGASAVAMALAFVGMLRRWALRPLRSS